MKLHLESVALIRSLLRRASARLEDDVAKIDLTVDELEAIRVLIDFHVAGPLKAEAETLDPESHAEKAIKVSSGESHEQKIKIDWADLKSKPRDDVRLCVDFGTAFSKVCLVGEGDRIQKPLNIGDLAGYEKPLLVPSSVLIAGGRIYFGADAIARSRQANIRHRRIDAIKQFLSKGQVEDIASHVIEGEYLSDSDRETAITRDEVFRLFCAYLTSLAESAAEIQGYKGNTLARRFARPAWDKERSAKAEAYMNQILMDARAVAHALRSKWVDGVPIALAKDVIAASKQCPPEDQTSTLVRHSVLEATAAANAVTSGFAEMEAGQLLAVVDVGAGTTDFGLFIFSRKGDQLRVAEIAPGSHVLRQAGDTLDDYLASIILGKLGYPPGSDMELRERAAVNNRRRFLKEELFAEGLTRYGSNEDTVVELALQEFLADPRVKAFTDDLLAAFNKSLSAVKSQSVDARGGHIKVVLTGGGATLPMVQDLLSGGTVHRCRPVETDLESLRSIDPNLPEVFGQFAVALGGALEHLPDQLTDVTEFGAGAPRTVYAKSFT